MEEELKVKKNKKSRLVALFLLIPAMLFGLISVALSVIAFGLIPVIPSLISIVFTAVSWFSFKKSFKKLSLIIVAISTFSALYSIVQGTLIKKEVAIDSGFDSTIVKAQQGIDDDLGEAFSNDSFSTTGSPDTSAVLTEFQKGEKIYLSNCAVCHMADGKGIEGIYPPLAGSNYLRDVNKTIGALVFGLKDKIIVNGKFYNKPMLESDLNDTELVLVINYVFTAWDNSIKLITSEQIQDIRSKKDPK
jgi:cytochrome c551